MPNPKRYTVIEALKTRLQGITVANGYYNDLATRIDVWRVAPYLPVELPRVNILDTEDTFLEAQTGPITALQDWQLRVEIYAIVPISQVLTLRNLMADIYNAIGGFRVSGDPTLGGNVIYTYPVRDIIEISQEDKSLATGSISFHIHYRYNKYAEP